MLSNPHLVHIFLRTSFNAAIVSQDGGIKTLFIQSKNVKNKLIKLDLALESIAIKSESILSYFLVMYWRIMNIVRQ